MSIKTLQFSNYKAFLREQTLSLKPITLLIGKNSSGKSSIAKLFTLLENSLSGFYDEPLLLKNNDVSLGGRFLDLVYNQQPSSPIDISIEFENGIKLSVSILATTADYELKIIKWQYKSADFNLLLEYHPNTGYTDPDGTTYDCTFKGFMPTQILANGNIDLSKKISKDLMIEVDYIGPFRILPERQFHLIGKMSYDKTGSKGENAYPILGVSEYMKGDIHLKVGEWYENNFNGWKLIVKSTNKPFLEIVLAKDKSEINIVDVGQGMNQALPLVTRANISKPKSITIIEQPELHLHPAAHADLAELFAHSALVNNQSFVIETHAENFVLRLRKLIIENDFGLTKDDIIIYWVEDCEFGGQEIHEITIDENGVLSSWPDGVFNENLEEILEIKNALKRKKEESTDDSKV